MNQALVRRKLPNAAYLMSDILLCSGDGEIVCNGIAFDDDIDSGIGMSRRNSSPRPLPTKFVLQQKGPGEIKLAETLLTMKGH